MVDEDPAEESRAKGSSAKNGSAALQLQRWRGGHSFGGGHSYGGFHSWGGGHSTWHGSHGHSSCHSSHSGVHHYHHNDV